MIVVISQGCAANFGDGEKIARILSKKHEVSFEFPDRSVATPAQLEAFYLNVCTVKGNTGALKLLRRAASSYPDVPIYITGCAPKDFREEAIRAVPQVQFTTLSDLENDPLFISISGNVTQDRTSERDEAITRHKNVLRESPFVGIVNIEEGCLDACAFCSTHPSKGASIALRQTPLSIKSKRSSMTVALKSSSPAKTAPVTALTSAQTSPNSRSAF